LNTKQYRTHHYITIPPSTATTIFDKTKPYLKESVTKDHQKFMVLRHWEVGRKIETRGIVLDGESEFGYNTDHQAPV